YDALPKGASAARNKFFARWAGERLAATKADIYVLIVKQAGRVEIAMNEETAKKAFTDADRKLLRDRLVKRFKEKEYDTALREATTFIERRLEANLPPINVVRDRAGFFSAEAVARANSTIKNFRAAFKRDLTVETFPSVPADKAKAVEDMS